MKYTYPTTYAPKTISAQLEILKGLFPDLAKSTSLIDLNVENNLEALFLIPHYKLFASTYNKAVEVLLEKMTVTRPFQNWLDGKLGPKYLNQLPVKDSFWATAPDFVVISAQFGLKYAGSSVATTRKELEGKHEMPLGLFEILIMLLTHPERLQSYNDLWIDCPGDEYAPDGRGQFSRAPILFFYDGRLRLGAFGLSDASKDCGGASGGVFSQSTLAPRTPDTSESLTLSLAELSILKSAVPVITKILKKYEKDN